MVCRFLTAVGRRDIPVAAGATPQPAEEIEWQIQYRRHPAVIFNRTAKPVKETAVEFLYRQLKAQPGELTLVAVGPLTNIARLLREHPDCKPWIKRIVIMGGSVRVGYKRKPPPEAEWNIKCDIKAAQGRVRLRRAAGRRAARRHADAEAGGAAAPPACSQADTPLTYQVQALYQLWDAADADPVRSRRGRAVLRRAVLHDGGPAPGSRRQGLDTRRQGQGQRPRGHGDSRRRVPEVVRRARRLGGQGGAAEAAAATCRGRSSAADCRTASTAFEDYETDIEKRWWMSGKAETANVPPGSRRACRGVLTQDFDDLQGDMKTMYTAVIFNPVPGPPMGKNTRLSFRYWLKGTDTLRVQIYSLTNGYHRYLSLTGLPQGRWQSATVDMTQCRRPDGSGGPLSEDERIDDIQFYVDPRGRTADRRHRAV